MKTDTLGRRVTPRKRKGCRFNAILTGAGDGGEAFLTFTRYDGETMTLRGKQESVKSLAESIKARKVTVL